MKLVKNAAIPVNAQCLDGNKYWNFSMINVLKCPLDDCDSANFEKCGILNEQTQRICGCNFVEIVLSSGRLELNLEPDSSNVCLGPIGFPCKSNPFKNNNSHISCHSGFCDEALDMCTSKESSQHKQTSGADFKTPWRATLLITFSQILHKFILQPLLGL